MIKDDVIKELDDFEQMLNKSDYYKNLISGELIEFNHSQFKIVMQGIKKIINRNKVE